MPLIGNLPVLQELERVRKSGQEMDNPMTWIIRNSDLFMEKKIKETGVADLWHPVILFNFISDSCDFVIGDPAVFESIVK